MLKIKDMDACYGESKIIPALSLDVEKGKIVCLIGRNGVGKSTTLKSIMDLSGHRREASGSTERKS